MIILELLMEIGRKGLTEDDTVDWPLSAILLLAAVIIITCVVAAI